MKSVSISCFQTFPPLTGAKTGVARHRIWECVRLRPRQTLITFSNQRNLQWSRDPLPKVGWIIWWFELTPCARGGCFWSNVCVREHETRDKLKKLKENAKREENEPWSLCLPKLGPVQLITDAAVSPDFSFSCLSCGKKNQRRAFRRDGRRRSEVRGETWNRSSTSPE